MKKADSALTFFASLVLIVIVLILFQVSFLLSSSSKTEFAINQISVANLQINLINYLRTPLKQETVQDLIVDSYYNNKYDELEKISREIFKKVYDKEKCPLWNIKGKVDDNKFFEYESEFDVRKYTLNPNPRNFLNLFNKNYISSKESSIEIILPENKKAKITLIEGCLNE